MAKAQNFYFWEERKPQQIIEYGDEAPITLKIMSNVTELKKLIRLLEEAIEWTNDPTCKGKGFSEDDVDDTHVEIDAYADGMRIKLEPPTDNPFEGWQ